MSLKDCGHGLGCAYKVDHYLTPPCIQWEILMTRTNQRRQDIFYRNTVRQLGLEEEGWLIWTEYRNTNKHTAHSS